MILIWLSKLYEWFYIVKFQSHLKIAKLLDETGIARGDTTVAVQLLTVGSQFFHITEHQPGFTWLAGNERDGCAQRRLSRA